MITTGKIENGHVRFADGELLKISKYQRDLTFTEGEEVKVKIDTEYPESCDNDPFCMGDETCIQCLLTNKIAVIKK
jgi:hypothetical protein